MGIFSSWPGLAQIKLKSKAAEYDSDTHLTRTRENTRSTTRAAAARALRRSAADPRPKYTLHKKNGKKKGNYPTREERKKLKN